jgi:uncharacterized protein (DUF488 family)
VDVVGIEMLARIYSVGHSSLSFDQFMSLLESAEVNAIADVRSSPFSKWVPWFSQSQFKESLRRYGVAYSFLGSELGGRPLIASMFKSGVADYLAMAAAPSFLVGLDRLVRGGEKYRIAMVCSERDPLHCHRCLLVSRNLMLRGVETYHIHSDGSQEPQSEAEERLLQEENLHVGDLLAPRSQRLDEAYLRRNSRVAYSVDSKKAK